MKPVGVGGEREAVWRQVSLKLLCQDRVDPEETGELLKDPGIDGG